jgi:hypothetical protein
MSKVMTVSEVMAEQKKIENTYNKLNKINLQIDKNINEAVKLFDMDITTIREVMNNAINSLLDLNAIYKDKLSSIQVVI